MAGLVRLVPAIHILKQRRRGCPGQGWAWRRSAWPSWKTS